MSCGSMRGMRLDERLPMKLVLVALVMLMTALAGTAWAQDDGSAREQAKRHFIWEQ